MILELFQTFTSDDELFMLTELVQVTGCTSHATAPEYEVGDLKSFDSLSALSSELR